MFFSFWDHLHGQPSSNQGPAQAKEGTSSIKLGSNERKQGLAQQSPK